MFGSSMFQLVRLFPLPVIRDHAHLSSESQQIHNYKWRKKQLEADISNSARSSKMPGSVSRPRCKGQNSEEDDKV